MGSLRHRSTARRMLCSRGTGAGTGSGTRARASASADEGSRSGTGAETRFLSISRFRPLVRARVGARVFFQCRGTRYLRASMPPYRTDQWRESGWGRRDDGGERAEGSAAVLVVVALVVLVVLVVLVERFEVVAVAVVAVAVVGVGSL